MCFFGQLRDLEAFAQLKQQLQFEFDADLFVATWNSVGSRQIDPQGRLVFLEQLIPPEFKDWFHRLKLRDICDLKSRFPELYDLVTAEHTVPIGKELVTGLTGKVSGHHLASPEVFDVDVLRMSAGEFLRRPLHVQNQIRMWHLINRVLLLKRGRENENGQRYSRVLLLRTDLRFSEQNITRLKDITQSVRPGVVASDFDPIAWVGGGIGDRFFVGHSTDIDTYMIPWRHVAYCFANTAGQGATFLQALAPHRIARDMLLASGLIYKPVQRDLVDFDLSRRSSHFEAKLRTLLQVHQHSRYPNTVR